MWPLGRHHVVSNNLSSIFVRHGSSGRGWYGRAVEKLSQEKPESKAYDYYAPAPDARRPQAYVDITVDGRDVPRMVIELAQDVVPKTVDNFVKLLSTQGYAKSKIHQIYRDSFISGGDIIQGNGTGGHSSSETSRYFADENHTLQFTEPGVIAMANAGVDTNASQFFITMKELKHLNGRYVAFGKVIQGMDAMTQINDVYAVKGKPSAEIEIKGCGLVE